MSPMSCGGANFSWPPARSSALTDASSQRFRRRSRATLVAPRSPNSRVKQPFRQNKPLSRNSTPALPSPASGENPPFPKNNPFAPHPPAGGPLPPEPQAIPHPVKFFEKGDKPLEI